MPLIIECSASPTEVDLAIVDAGIDQHNLAEPEIHNVAQLATFARYSNHQVKGGAVGRTWGECCELQQLWVAQDARGRGTGNELMNSFEREARRRGCALVYLDTFTFQARPFYEKRGYEVVLETPGFPNGIVKYTMHKRLPEK
jgi:GNAT superfamily N-acetyltransferase